LRLPARILVRRILVLGALAIGAACGDELLAPPDAGSPDAPPPDAAGPPLRERLSQTGLYADPTTREIASDLRFFEPRHGLWTDGARKRRWVRLPAGAQIDTSELEHWDLPVGAQLFKEFSAPDGTLLETRLIERRARSGRAEDDFWMGAFVWLADGTDAVFAEEGAADVNGTAHDVPSVTQCQTCHVGEPGRALGFSALQLSGPGPAGTRLEDLAAAGLLTHPPAEGEVYAAPGPPEVAAALGYLHANCGHCHNPSGSARPDVDMNLRLYLDQRTPEETSAYQTAVDVPLFRFMAPGIELRVAPGAPDESGLVYRMGRRGTGAQMPPIGTEAVDEDGLELVRGWIEGLPADVLP
jgi:hypothetical protein